MQGQTVVVVGGSQGIGLAVARQALAAGARVVVTGRDPARLEAARQALPDLDARAVDATDAEALAGLFGSLPRIDHLFHAAGAFVGGSLLEGDPTAARTALDARVWGAAAAIRAAAPRLAPRASITLTGGLSTDRPVAGAWATAVGTAAAEQLARVLALELAPVRVNAVAPGWTDTPMWDAILGPAKREAFEDVARRVPVARLATADEVADAVLFLMRNGAVTGEVLHVDGGHRLV